MIERTEELGLAAYLTISVGGQQVRLRTLDLDESEAWLAQVDAVGKVESTDIPLDVQLDLVRAYDKDGVLGDDLRKHFTKRELYDATNQMVSAEAPFLEDARSVVEASGRSLWKGMGALMYRLVVQSLRESSTNGPAQSGGSTPRRSAKRSLKSVS